MRWKSHVRCGVGEKVEITSNPYLSLTENERESVFDELLNWVHSTINPFSSIEF